LIDKEGTPSAGKAGKTRTGDAPGGAIYYKVVAVDAAGNELGIRGGAESGDPKPRK